MVLFQFDPWWEFLAYYTYGYNDCYCYRNCFSCLIDFDIFIFSLDYVAFIFCMQSTEKQKIWISIQYACMLLQIQFAGMLSESVCVLIFLCKSMFLFYLLAYFIYPWLADLLFLFLSAGLILASWFLSLGYFASSLFFHCNLPCLPLLFLISVLQITGLKMLKFYVWGWSLLLLLCLSYHYLKPRVASCFKWHHLAFHLQHWANAWDR
jgi:hypothetical protein